jgi:hypothetical protein
MAGHTPGPWTFVGSAIEADAPDRPGFTDVVAWASFDVGEGTAQSNGHLIAAATEMYEALKALLAYVRTDGWVGLEAPEGYRAGARAIAKAEGRS